MFIEQQKQTPISGVAPLKRKEFDSEENQPCGKKPYTPVEITGFLLQTLAVGGQS